MIQFLKPDGTLVDIAPHTSISPLIHKDMYAAMMRTRLFYEHCEQIETKQGHMRLHIGPKGQEAAEVASVYALDANDWICYYARSYGAALARGVSFRSLIDSFYYYGKPPPDAVDDFLAHRVLLPYTWVGLHLAHAVGIASAEKLRGTGSIAIAFFGDGAMAESDTHGALAWASVYEVPVLFICENNQYAISTPSRMQNPSPTFAAKANAYGIESERVDGNDPLAMFDAVSRLAHLARTRARPMFIEAVTYRDGPHTSAVGEIVRISDEEKNITRENDPLKRYRLFRFSEIGAAHFGAPWTETEEHALHKAITQEIKSVTAHAYEEYCADYESKKMEAPALPAARVSARTHATVPDLTERIGPEIIENADCREAVNMALFDTLQNDTERRIMCVGQDIGKAGGVMRTTALSKAFAYAQFSYLSEDVLYGFLPQKCIFPDRIVDALLNEAAIAGISLGLSIRGMHPIFEMQFSGFVKSALHQVEEYGRYAERYSNRVRPSGILRLPFGHSDSIEYHNECQFNAFTSMHGVVIACPSTPQDFYDMFRAAAEADCLVAFFEHLSLYRALDIRESITRRAPLCAIEDFGIRVARQGSDVTIASCGRMLHESLAAAALLEDQHGISAEVLDVRILAPLDKKTLLNSVRKTGRFLVVQEECAHGFGAYLVATVADEALEHIQARRIPILGTPCAFAPPPRFWHFHVPNTSLITAQVQALVQE